MAEVWRYHQFNVDEFMISLLQLMTSAIRLSTTCNKMMHFIVWKNCVVWLVVPLLYVSLPENYTCRDLSSFNIFFFYFDYKSKTSITRLMWGHFLLFTVHPQSSTRRLQFSGIFVHVYVFVDGFECIGWALSSPRTLSWWGCVIGHNDAQTSL